MLKKPMDVCWMHFLILSINVNISNWIKQFVFKVWTHLKVLSINLNISHFSYWKKQRIKNWKGCKSQAEKLLSCFFVYFHLFCIFRESRGHFSSKFGTDLLSYSSLSLCVRLHIIPFLLCFIIVCLTVHFSFFSFILLYHSSSKL